MAVVGQVCDLPASRLNDFHHWLLRRVAPATGLSIPPSLGLRGLRGLRWRLQILDLVSKFRIHRFRSAKRCVYRDLVLGGELRHERILAGHVAENRALRSSGQLIYV